MKALNYKDAQAFAPVLALTKIMITLSMTASSLANMKEEDYSQVRLTTEINKDMKMPLPKIVSK